MANHKNYSLETERLILRLPEMKNAKRIQELFGVWDVVVNTLTIPYPLELSTVEQWIRDGYEREANSRRFDYSIIRSEDDLLLGGCHIIVDFQHEKAVVGYWLGKPYWGKGYATEALRRMIDFCFADLDLNRVEANFFATNAASQRVMEKAGMTLEGIHRQSLIREFPAKNYRVYHDDGTCAILRAEWEANR